MVQAIFFDVYGTLAGFRPDRFEIQSEACSRFGMELTREGVLRGYALADVFMSDQNAVKPVRMMDDEERARFFGEYERRVLRGCGFDVTVEQAMEIWSAVRSIPYGMARYDDVLPAFDLLKQQGIHPRPHLQHERIRRRNSREHGTRALSRLRRHLR